MSTIKPKKIIIADPPTIIKKTFENTALISHKFTAPSEHPTETIYSKLRVSEINGIGPYLYSKFCLEGIHTVEDFVNAGVYGISKVLGRPENNVTTFYLKGLAVYQNRVIKIKELKNISQNPIYLDIETDLYQKTVWMIGIYITKANEFIQLVADKPSHEPKIIRQCLEILSDYPNEQIITYSGSRFDERILRKRFDQEKLKHNHLIFDDILLDIRASLAFPIKAYKLSEIGEFYGYNFKHPDMDGRLVAEQYSKYAYDFKNFRGYQKFCDYNEDDVKSMASVVETIYDKNRIDPNSNETPITPTTYNYWEEYELEREIIQNDYVSGMLTWTEYENALDLIREEKKSKRFLT